jgi:hypothetical protein
MVDGHDGRLAKHDTAAADIDEGIGCAKVDGDVARAETWEEVGETDDLLLSVRLNRVCYTPPRATPNAR